MLHSRSSLSRRCIHRLTPDMPCKAAVQKILSLNGDKGTAYSKSKGRKSGGFDRCISVMLWCDFIELKCSKSISTFSILGTIHLVFWPFFFKIIHSINFSINNLLGNFLNRFSFGKQFFSEQFNTFPNSFLGGNSIDLSE